MLLNACSLYVHKNLISGNLIKLDNGKKLLLSRNFNFVESNTI